MNILGMFKKNKENPFTRIAGIVAAQQATIDRIEKSIDDASEEMTAAGAIVQQPEKAEKAENGRYELFISTISKSETDAIASANHKWGADAVTRYIKGETTGVVEPIITHCGGTGDAKIAPEDWGTILGCLRTAYDIYNKNIDKA